MLSCCFPSGLFSANEAGLGNMVVCDSRVTDFGSIAKDTDKSNDSGATKVSTKSSQTSFIESHPLPEQLFRSGRGRGIRLEGDLVNATRFVNLLFEDNAELNLGRVEDRLRRVGFSTVEAYFFRCLFRKFLMITPVQNLSPKMILPYLGFYFSKAIKAKSVVDFGFEVMDQNSDGEVSPSELGDFLKIFWDEKVENILRTYKGEEFFHKLLEEQYDTGNLDFYKLMGNLLCDPYIDVLEFEAIKKAYIMPGSHSELNLPHACRKKILDYEERAEILEGGLVKTEVLRDAEAVVHELLTTKASDFVHKQEQNRELACVLHDEFSTKDKKFGKAQFKDFLLKNLVIAGFVRDLQQLFLKSLQIIKSQEEQMDITSEIDI